MLDFKPCRDFTDLNDAWKVIYGQNCRPMILARLSCLRALRALHVYETCSVFFCTNYVDYIYADYSLFILLRKV